MVKQNKTSNHAQGTKHYSVKEAQELIIREARDWGFEEVRLEDAYGRVLYEDIFADRNYPPFNRSAVDGFAIRSKDLVDKKIFEIIEEVYAGAEAKTTIEPGTTIKIMTGAPVPPGADAVIKVEDAEVTNNKVKFLATEIKSKANISIEGEDTKKGERVLYKNQRCTPLVSGTLAALGQSTVKVFKQPSIAILSTGNEIKSVHEEILSYQIRDSNSYSLAGFFQHYGISSSYRKIVTDDKEELRTGIKSVWDADIIILSGGVSMGDADFVPEILQELGVQKIFHKAGIKPGKPIWFGKTESHVVFGLPGNPFSVQVAFKIFIEPFLRSSLGLNPIHPIKLPLRGIKKKKTTFDEYFPCRITHSSLEIISFNGSGDIRAAITSDGIALHPGDLNEIKDGEYIEFLFWNSP